VTSTRRTTQEQAVLWRRFQAGLALFPACPPGTSTHEKGLALDVVLADPGLLAVAVELGELLGFLWGGEGDPVHFQDDRVPFGCLPSI
jgi:D-alanyl-D-alanine dipeptidase